MSSLRQQMIRVLELHRKSPDTIKPYVNSVAQLAKHYGVLPLYHVKRQDIAVATRVLKPKKSGKISESIQC